VARPVRETRVQSPLWCPSPACDTHPGSSARWCRGGHQGWHCSRFAAQLEGVPAPTGHPHGHQGAGGRCSCWRWWWPSLKDAHAACCCTCTCYCGQSSSGIRELTGQPGVRASSVHTNTDPAVGSVSLRRSRRWRRNLVASELNPGSEHAYVCLADGGRINRPHAGRLQHCLKLCPHAVRVGHALPVSSDHRRLQE
jgi:hypothetical protein